LVGGKKKKGEHRWVARWPAAWWWISLKKLGNEEYAKRKRKKKKKKQAKKNHAGSRLSRLKCDQGGKNGCEKSGEKKKGGKRMAPRKRRH